MGAHASIRPMQKGNPCRECARSRLGILGSALLFLLLFQTGCLSLRSVSATGAVGTWIYARVGATKDLLLYCDAENLLAGLTTTCPREQTAAAIADIDRYSQVLSEYATQLKNLADNNDARSADPVRTLVWNIQRVSQQGALSIDPSSVAMQQGAASLLALITEESRRRKLETVIKETHPHVVAVCDGLLARVNLLGEPARQMVQSGIPFRIRALQELDRSVKVSDPASRQQRQATMLALLHVGHDLSASYDALLSYKKAVLAFSRGHQILFDSVTKNRSLRSHDKEIFENLRKELPELLK